MVSVGILLWLLWGFEFAVSLVICITALIMLHYAPSLDDEDVKQYGIAVTAVSWGMWGWMG